MRSRVYVTVRRPSVCLSHRLTAAAVCCGFAAERSAGRTYRSTAVGAGVQQQQRRSTALSSKCTHCYFDSRVDESEHRLVLSGLLASHAVTVIFKRGYQHLDRCRVGNYI